MQIRFRINNRAPLRSVGAIRRSPDLVYHIDYLTRRPELSKVLAIFFSTEIRPVGKSLRFSTAMAFDFTQD